MNIVTVAVSQDVIKPGDQRRITARVSSVAADGTLSDATATSATYFLFRQDAAGTGVTLVNPGGTAMSAAGSDWEATITLASGNGQFVLVSAMVGGVPVDEPGRAWLVPPKFYFDPTELFM